MKLSNIIKIADFFTLGSLVCGMLAIFFAITKSFTVAALLMLVCVVLDMLDGYVARAMKQKNTFGGELDSLCDIVAFGVSPIVFGYMQGLNTPWHLLIFMLFIIAGALRLARFNVISLPYYEGLPITLNGVLIPLLYFLKIFNNYTIFIYLIMALLMVSSIRIKKPTLTQQ